MDKYDPNKEVLFKESEYVVCVTEARDPVLEEVVPCYGVYNTKTGIREAEARRLLSAVEVCRYIADPLEEDGPTQMEMELKAPTVN